MNKKASIIFLAALSVSAVVILFADKGNRSPAIITADISSGTTGGAQVRAVTEKNIAAHAAADPLSIKNKAALTAVTTFIKVADTPDPIKLSFSAGDFSGTFLVPASSTVYDAMTVLASTTKFTFKSRYYDGLGYFIDEINGKRNSGGTYWTLYVNGKYSDAGASQSALKQGDSVEWKYEKK